MTKDIPVESRMRKVIDTIETGLLRQKPRHASQPTNLRNLAGKAKGIRQPGRRGSEPKLSLEESLTVQELAN